MPFDPARAIADLRAIAELTGGHGTGGARRVCWTDEWLKARAYVHDQLAATGAEIDRDEAGNVWAYLRGSGGGMVIVGSHVDSVPEGGWLDGVLGIAGALEVLRATAEAGTPPCTVAFVDFADEEGARFARSLFGSSAVSGYLVPAELADLRDRDGQRLADVLREYGVEIDRVLEAGNRLDGARAYLELHIEQGPVLEAEGLAVGTVLGTVGVERFRARFTGQAAHAGSTPIRQRRDSFLAAARTALELREIALRHDGVCTVGSAVCTPGVATAVPGRTELLVDQRHLDADELAAMRSELFEAAERLAAEEGCTVEIEQVWRIEPIPFDEGLIDVARTAVREVTGTDRTLPSGPLHDAAEVARTGVPTVMVFSSSTNGISHAKEEDTPVEHLELALRAFGLAAERVIRGAGG
ncbi:MAG: allantoate deiminase [Gaiellaceae bacterium]|nr:allantoate deiminase [Gaiellaceae bacterium]